MMFSKKALLGSLALLVVVLFSSYMVFKTSSGSSPKKEDSALVETTSTQDENTVPDCEVAPSEKSLCFAEFFAKKAKTSSVEEALELMYESAKTIPAVGMVCHDLSHKFGQLVYSFDSLDYLMSIPDRSCPIAGYRHGLLQGFAESATDEQFWSKFSTLCTKAPDEFDRTRCNHSLGHGIAFRVKGSIFEVEPKCAPLKEDRDFNDCIEGVVMSYAIDYPSEGSEFLYDSSEKPFELVPLDDVDEVCTKFSQRAKPECWGMVSSFVRPEMSLDETLVFGVNICSKAGSFVDSCSNSFGQALSFKGSATLPDRLSLDDLFKENLPRCKKFQDYNACVDGLVSATANVWYATAGSFDEVPDFCALAEPIVKPSCVKSFETYEKEQNGDAKARGTD